jgi:hypothetical protein
MAGLILKVLLKTAISRVLYLQLPIEKGVFTYMSELLKPVPEEIPEIEDELLEELEETASSERYTSETLGLKTLGKDGLVAHDNGHYSIVRKLESIDVRMMSAAEKSSLVSYGADFFNALTRRVSFYAAIEPKDMEPYLAGLAAKRKQEPDPVMKQNFFIEEDHIRELTRTSNLTERVCYMALSATRSELKSISLAGKDGTEQNGSEAGNESGVVGIFKKRWREMMEADAENKSVRSEEAIRIPDVIAETLKFTAGSYSDALSRIGMAGQSLEHNSLSNHLARRLNSPYATYPTSDSKIKFRNRKLNGLDRAGGAEFTETSDWLCFRNPTTGESRYAASLYITSYPKVVPLGALYEILRIKDIPLQVALHITPWDSTTAQKKLKNREQILWAYKLNDQSQAGDLVADYRRESIRKLREKLARGDGRIFKVGLRIAVLASNPARLRNDLRRVRQRLEEMGYGVATATRNQRRAFLSTLPTGRDYLSEGRFFADRSLHTNMLAENVMCFMPNIIPDSGQGGGIILGVNRADGSLVTFNRWKLVAPHTVVIATTGGGKTVAMDVECVREMEQDQELQCFYVDPQGVVGSVCKLVNGEELDLGPRGNSIINPMDRYVLGGQAEELSERLLFLYPLFEMMMRASITAADRTAIKNALERLYSHFEHGESVQHLLSASFGSQRLYAPCRPYLQDWEDKEGNRHRGIISRLSEIYRVLSEKHKIPASGLVEGSPNKSSSSSLEKSQQRRPEKTRPVCHFSSREGRFFYRGEGETSTLLSPESFEPASKYASLPPAVWYPDPQWIETLSRDFLALTQQPDEYGDEIFWMLDKTAKMPALRDAFVELKRGMPVLSDLMPLLAAEGLTTLVESLDTFVSDNGFGKLFNGYTNVRLDKRFISFNVRDLDQNYLRPIRLFQVVNYTWGMARAVKRPRMFIFDEFGLMVKNFSDVGHYVSDLFMRGRAFYLSMTAIVQNITNLIDYEAGLICMENAERVILLRQQDVATDRLVERLRITAGHVHYLLRARNGESLQKIEGRWIPVKYDVPQAHLNLFDTRPQAERLEVMGSEDE